MENYTQVIRTGTKWTKRRLTQIYVSMIDRCYNHNNINYSRYGGRGIGVCSLWRLDRLAFFKFALTNGYNDSLTIDRIDNEKGYFPSNCRFVKLKRNLRNKANTRSIKINDKPIAIIDFCDIIGANYRTVLALSNHARGDEYILNHPKVTQFYLQKKDLLESSNLEIVRA